MRIGCQRRLRATLTEEGRYVFITDALSDSATIEDKGMPVLLVLSQVVLTTRSRDHDGGHGS